jgi:two-component system alkaline phosphatase synthesis response regulator PhoP
MEGLTMATILLVEDDETIRTMYTTGLTKEGFSVTPVGTGPDALVLVGTQQFDFILLDMLLGGMSGLDFLQAAELQVKSPQTRVIGLSNVGSDNIIERAHVLGVVDFLEKAEFEPTKLAAYLKQLG